MQYDIKGKPFCVLECQLNAGESIKCQNGAMFWMTPNMKMETSAGGGVKKALGRMFSGEAIFNNTYTAIGQGGMIALGSDVPGDILPIEIGPGREIIAQKTAYLASTPGVELSAIVNKKMSTGLVGGEGFIMQKISGNGLCFFEIAGSVVSYTLGPGQALLIDTGYLAMMEASCQMDIVAVEGGLKNKLLGGEGFFNTRVTGPGKVWVQTNRHLTISAAD